MRIALATWCGLIFYLSSRSDFPDTSQWYPAWLPEQTIVAHLFLYFILGALAFLDFSTESSKWLSTRAFVSSIVFSASYGLSDEFHQLFVPGRHFQLLDLAVDISGAFLAVGVIVSLRKINNKNKE